MPRLLVLMAGLLAGMLLTGCGQQAISTVKQVSEVDSPITATAPAARLSEPETKAEDTFQVQPTAVTSIPSPTSPATAELLPAASPSPPPEINWLKVSGKTGEGLAYLGNPDAPVTLIDYSDFMWTKCRAYVLGTESKIKDAYVKSGQVRLVFNPNLAHGDRSLQTHHAAECAAEQQAFWALHDLMFQQQQELFSGNIRGAVKGFAYELGLDTDQFIDCIDEQRYVDLIHEQDERRQQLDIRHLPTLDLNGRLVVGAQGFEALQEIIEPILDQNYRNPATLQQEYRVR